MIIVPLNDKILIKVDETEEVTAGGIILPDSAKKITQVGTVVAVGPGQQRIKEDDRVIYAKYGGVDVDITGENLVLLDYESIYGVVIGE